MGVPSGAMVRLARSAVLPISVKLQVRRTSDFHCSSAASLPIANSGAPSASVRHGSLRLQAHNVWGLKLTSPIVIWRDSGLSERRDLILDDWQHQPKTRPRYARPSNPPTPLPTASTGYSSIANLVSIQSVCLHHDRFWVKLDDNVIGAISSCTERAKPFFCASIKFDITDLLRRWSLVLCHFLLIACRGRWSRTPRAALHDLRQLDESVLPEPLPRCDGSPASIFQKKSPFFRRKNKDRRDLSGSPQR